MSITPAPTIIGPTDGDAVTPRAIGVRFMNPGVE
jgi:hypothetical protein